MELLKQRILKDGIVKPGGILKVDSFLNHQIDIGLYNEIGKEFKRLFEQSNITKILTIEASGIGIACITAQYFNVPVVFAKKTVSKNLDGDLYITQVTSFTKGKTYDVVVSKKFLNENDNILIIDDFLAKGMALIGLIDLCNQSGAKVAGAGIVIEKVFQNGGNIIREKGIRVESLAKISSMDDESLVFED